MARLRRKSSWLRRARRWATILVLAFVLVTTASVLALRWIDPPLTMFMLLDDAGRDPVAHRWADATGISASLAFAVVASEDQKFPTHFGFDLDSIRDSIEAGADGEPVRGASTITQQVAKNLFLWPGRSYLRKALEAYLTVLLEATLSKQRILEIYLNVAEFGPGTYGAAAASERFFGKGPKALTDAEAALLAAVLPNPKVLSAARPSGYVRQRQLWILGQMQRLRRDGALRALDWT